MSAQRSGGHGFASWCRTHPRAGLTGAGVLVALAVAGAVAGSAGSSDADRPAAGGSTAGRASTSAPSSAPSSSPSTVSALSETPADRQQRSNRTALTVLATLTVKGRAPRTGYDRARFGDAWTDDNDAPLGHNGCDTRNDVLRRDLTSVVLKPGSNGCAVASGNLRDPYTATVIPFQRGVTSSLAVQIDHVVALSDAWQTGAQYYDEPTRVEFANDPLNLLAVDGPTNEAKRDGDAATWLPPNKAYRCAYVARQVAVKARYRLWMTPAEHDATDRVLRTCPDQPAPAEFVEPRIVRATPSGRAPSTPTAATTPPAATSSPTEPVHYDNCAAARAAGAAPLHRGDPGYDRRLDRDGDGTACE